MTILAAVCLLFAPPGAAEERGADAADSKQQTASSEVSRTAVRKIIRRLASDSAAERAAAEKELAALGPAVLDVLDAIVEESGIADPNVRRSIDRVRGALLTEEATSAGKATKVTLQGEMTLSEAIRAVEKQTGNKVIDYRKDYFQEAPELNLKLDVKDKNFWAAMNEIMRQGKLSLYPYPEEPAAALVQQDETVGDVTALPTADAGPFRVQATDLAAVRDLRIPKGNQLQVQLQVLWEPRLSPISLELPMVTVSAADEAGGELELKTIGVLQAEIAPGGFATEMALPFELPKRGLEKIARLKGQMTALVPGRADTYRFTNLDKFDKPIVYERAGTKVVLESVSKNNDAWQFDIVVAFEKASGALQSHRDWIYRNVTYLQAPDKKQIEFGLYETFRATENEIGLRFYYPLSDDLKGFTLVYKTPSIILRLPVKFELRDLPLP